MQPETKSIRIPAGWATFLQCELKTWCVELAQAQICPNLILNTNYYDSEGHCPRQCTQHPLTHAIKLVTSENLLHAIHIRTAFTLFWSAYAPTWTAKIKYEKDGNAKTELKIRHRILYWAPKFKSKGTGTSYLIPNQIWKFYRNNICQIYGNHENDWILRVFGMWRHAGNG